MSDDKQQNAATALVEGYRDAFERRDLEACVGFFDEQATIRFLFATYQGREAIEQWHADRFEADVQIVNTEAIRSEGDSVAIDAEATSRRLRFFKIDKVRGTATFQIKEGRITEAKFQSRSGSSGHLNWQFQ
jgi:hypothetical protein